MKRLKSGYVSIVGKTNAGKSTLLNNILGQKIAITSRKPQTTRHRFQGIKTKGQNEDLVKSISEKLPSRDHLYPEDQVTDISEKFLASEVIREKGITRLGDELPYRISVGIENFSIAKKVIHIDSIIYVEKQSQKGMLIGQSGSRLKSIGTASRLELEDLLDSKVMLKIWVKVKNGWSDNESVLPSMGYDISK